MIPGNIVEILEKRRIMEKRLKKISPREYGFMKVN